MGKGGKGSPREGEPMGKGVGEEADDIGMTPCVAAEGTDPTPGLVTRGHLGCSGQLATLHYPPCATCL